MINCNNSIHPWLVVAVLVSACGGTVDEAPATSVDSGDSNDAGIAESGVDATAPEAGYVIPEAGPGEAAPPAEAGPSEAGHADVEAGYVDVEAGFADVEAGADLCPLTLIQSGVLPDPPEAGNLFAGPIAVATDQGFLIQIGQESPHVLQGYRVAVADDGTVGASTVTSATSCPGSTVLNGIATAWNPTSGTGFLALSAKECQASGSGPRMHVENFGASGQSMASVAYELPGPLVLDSNQSAAEGSVASNFLLAASMPVGGSFLYDFDGIAVSFDVTPIPPGTTDANQAHVATSSALRATVGGSPNALALALSPTGGGPTSLHTIVGWGEGATALAAWNQRAAVVRATTDGVHVFAAQTGSNAATELHVDTEPRYSVDVAAVGDQLVVAAGGTSSDIKVWRVTGAGSVDLDLAPTLDVSLSPTEVTGLAGYDGQRVAVAAARGRVLVTWVVTPQPNTVPYPSIAGYAILACGE